MERETINAISRKIKKAGIICLFVCEVDFPENRFNVTEAILPSIKAFKKTIAPYMIVSALNGLPV